MLRAAWRSESVPVTMPRMGLKSDAWADGIRLAGPRTRSRSSIRLTRCGTELPPTEAIAAGVSASRPAWSGNSSFP